MLLRVVGVEGEAGAVPAGVGVAGYPFAEDYEGGVVAEVHALEEVEMTVDVVVYVGMRGMVVAAEGEYVLGHARGIFGRQASTLREWRLQL